MPSIYKLVFAGPVGSGKTTAIQTLSDIEVVRTEANASDEVQRLKKTTTVAMDYGLMKLASGDQVRLYGTPGQKRFDFMWDILTENALGLVLMLKASAPDPLADLNGYVTEFREFIDKTALVVGITHTEGGGWRVRQEVSHGAAALCHRGGRTQPHPHGVAGQGADLRHRPLQRHRRGMTEHTAMSTPADDPWLMLTPAGVLHAYAERVPDERAAMLQALMPRGASLRRSAWLAQASEHRTLLARALHEGWVHEVERELRAPDVRLDNYLPHAIAGLSGTRTAALASDDGFCLARVGYSEQEAETLCVAAADFFEFAARQKQRGWTGTGRAVSFFEGIDMLLPTTSFVLFWVDGTGYWLILGGEPLINNVAFVELVWGIRTAGARFAQR